MPTHSFPLLETEQSYSYVAISILMLCFIAKELFQQTLYSI